MYDLIIRNGTVVDGTRAPAYKADVCVKDGRIAAIAPDIKAQNVTFSSGRISVLVSEQGALKSVNILCSGALHLILSDAPASLSAVITSAEREFSIPQPALNALKQ